MDLNIPIFYQHIEGIINKGIRNYLNYLVRDRRRIKIINRYLSYITISDTVRAEGYSCVIFQSKCQLSRFIIFIKNFIECISLVYLYNLSNKTM